MSAPPSLVVSIHDVSPLTRDRVDAILAGLAAAGIARTSLLVVPDHHHKAPIAGDADFAAWLRAHLAAGHEAVLHGFFHRRERRERESASTQFFTRLYTADEGEFFDITLEEARTLLARGREALTECAGVDPTGFIAPAWLLSAAGEQAARELGFGYTTRLKTVTDLTAGKVLESQSLCWSVRSGWRRAASLGWNPLLATLLGKTRLLRISIHPPDITHPSIWYQIRCLATRAAKDRTPLTYRDFIDQWRSLR
jgi:predicted deacetylase